MQDQEYGFWGRVLGTKGAIATKSGKQSNLI